MQSSIIVMERELNEFQQPVGKRLLNWQSPGWPSVETMTGRYCRLEALHAAQHADSLYAAISAPDDAASWTYMAYGPFESRAEYDGWLSKHCGQKDPQFYAILDQASGRALGVAAYLRIMPSSGSIEVGHIHFSPELRRTRAATEAMWLMMRHAFALGYRRYEWKCNALNAASRSAALRLGFTYEGIFRQATVVKGRNRDTAWFAVIDQDWPALSKAFEHWLSPENFDPQGNQKISLTEMIRSQLPVTGEAI
jgi:RimJ/RimL family protein N-acetyltransferase